MACAFVNSEMFRIKWLLVEWETRVGFMPQYGLVHIRSLVGPTNELHTGKMIFVASGNGEMKQAKVVMSSDDRRFLEQQLISIEEHSQQVEAAAEACRAALAAQEVTPSAKPQLVMDLKTHMQSPGISSWNPDIDTYSQSESDSEPDHQTYKFKRGGNQFPNRVKSEKSSLMNHYKHASSSRHVGNGSSRGNTKANYDQRRQYHIEISTSNPYPKEQQVNDYSIMTYDQGTQTRPNRFNQGIRNIPKIEEKVSDLERVIEEMEEKFSILEATVDSWIAAPGSPDSFKRSTIPLQEVPHENIPNIEIVNSQAMIDRQRIRNVKTRESTPEMSECDDVSTNDMVGIGTGQTMVPRHIINQIDWNSYTMATRKLLMAVFPRRTLATHSLTGKSSPAFMNKPAKLCLDPVKVNDIVLAVTENCNVKDSLVRGSITTKCADENKMFRMRQDKYGKKQKADKRNIAVNGNNGENVPPPPPPQPPASIDTGNP